MIRLMVGFSVTLRVDLDGLLEVARVKINTIAVFLYGPVLLNLWEKTVISLKKVKQNLITIKRWNVLERAENESRLFR